MSRIFGILFFSLISFISVSYAEIPEIIQKYEVGDVSKFKTLDQSRRFYILEKKKIDLNGDKVEDLFFLVGQKDSPKSMLTSNVHAVLVDGKTGDEVSYLYREAASYIPGSEFADLTGDGVPEIITEYPSTSGAERYYVVGSFKDNKPKLYLDEGGIQKFARFKGEFKDNFVLAYTNEYLKVTVPVTIYGYKKVYVNQGVYSEDGKLLKPITTSEGKINGLDVLDVNNDGVYELYAYSNLNGISLGDVVAKSRVSIVFINGDFKAQNIEVSGLMYQMQ